eukprot:m.14614 g.14614  ORF g.14614 m.14614 type:complete len:264 (-) comp5167_c0_seq1:29-820(-)
MWVPLLQFAASCIVGVLFDDMSDFARMAGLAGIINIIAMTSDGIMSLTLTSIYSSLGFLFTSSIRTIGLTGGIASGKSTVSKMLQDRGYVIVDLDKLAREAVVPGSWGYKRVTAAIPQSVDKASEEINRERLRKLTFENKEVRKKLNQAIQLPIFVLLIRQILFHRMFRYRRHEVIMDAPLLFESGLHWLCRRTYLVACDEKIQLDRIVARDNVPREQAQAVINAQMKLSVKRKLANIVIENSGKMDYLQIQVHRHFSHPNVQ